MHKVSVIVPIYNVQKHIEKCARSLFEQTLDDIEYIFINDCTPDSSITILENVIKEYPARQPNIKILHQEVNGGQHIARPRGIANATGEYIIHCDPDDYIDKDMYQDMYNKAVEQNLDYVWCDYKVINKDNVKINSQNCPTNKEDLLRKLILGNYFMGALWNRMIKSSIVKNVSIINPVAPIIEDLTLVIQYTLLSERFGYINQPYYNYIIHEGGTMSSTKVRKRRECIKKNFQIILSCLQKNGWDILLKDEIFINKFNQKQGYLPLVVEEGDHQSWINLYPEINGKIFISPHISLHDKIGSLLILMRLRSFIYKLFHR